MDESLLSDNDFDSDEDNFTISSKKELKSDDSTANEDEKPKKTTSLAKKEKKSGVVYLSSIPTSMNVKKLSEEFSKYGDVGRIYLKPEENCPGWKKNRKFLEGWVEFFDKRVARMVAGNLNNKQVKGKRHNPWYYDLWNIKYLKKFKWLHLTEKINSERAARKKKLKMEISRAKKDTSKFKEIVEREKLQKKRPDKQTTRGEGRKDAFTYKQERPYRAADTNKSLKVKANDDVFLNSIFSGGFT